jgi:ParB/RepB/Spo0J family partition protein
MGKAITAPALSKAIEEALEAGINSRNLEVSPIPLDLIQPGSNDRVDFKKVPALADSIIEHGLLSPIVVRQITPDLYRIAGGETRYRAYCLLHDRDPANPKWMAIPAFVKEMDDDQESAIMLIENSVRQQLGPVEEAKGYHKRIVCQGWTVERCASETGYGVARIKNRLALLKLTDDILALIQSGNLAPEYGAIMGDANLDANFQALAMRAYNDNTSPNPKWFRGVCSELAATQAQSSLFDFFNLPVAVQQIVDAPILPPDVQNYTPQRRPKNPMNLLALMSRECRENAATFDKAGNWRKRNEYSAAATAIETALKLLEQAQGPLVKGKVA